MRLILILLLASASYGQTILSGVVSGSGPLPSAGTITFTPSAGAVSNPTTVTMSTATGCDSYIYHNTTGSVTSADTHTTTYSVTGAVTLYAAVIGCPGYADSTGSAAYTVTTPVTAGTCVANDQGGAGGATSTTSAATLGAGKAVFCVVAIRENCGARTASIADLSSGANTFTQIGSLVADPNLVTCTGIFYAKNTSAVTNNTYTGTWSTGGSSPSIACLAMNGASTSSPISATPTAGTAAGTTATTGTFSSVSGELGVFGGGIYDFGRTVTADTGYTMACQSPNKSANIQYKQFSGSASGLTNTLTINSSSALTNIGVTVH